MNKSSSAQNNDVAYGRGQSVGSVMNKYLNFLHVHEVPVSCQTSTPNFSLCPRSRPSALKFIELKMFKFVFESIHSGKTLNFDFVEITMLLSLSSQAALCARVFESACRHFVWPTTVVRRPRMEMVRVSQLNSYIIDDELMKL